MTTQAVPNDSNTTLQALIDRYYRLCTTYRVVASMPVWTEAARKYQAQECARLHEDLYTTYEACCRQAGVPVAVSMADMIASIQTGEPRISKE